MNGSLLRSNYNFTPPTISHGQGATLFDEQGKNYIDGSSGAMVANLGHGNNTIAEAASDQIKKIAYTYRTQFSNSPAEALANKLITLAKDKSKVFFLSSGSEATEAAVRLTLQYWREIGLPTKRKILSRKISYHGNTLGALSLSADARRHSISDITAFEPTVPPCYCYRCPKGLVPGTCNIECADLLENSILQTGPENVAAFITEPIIGASGGAIVPHQQYMKRIRNICDKYNILLIVDEVITGLGRTGEWFAMHHWKESSDITILGKGLNAGFTPLSAILLNERVDEAIRTGTRQVSFGHTHSGNPLSTAIALAVVEEIERSNLVERSRIKGAELGKTLTGIGNQFDMIGDVRGIGMLWGIEFNQPDSQLTPYPKEFSMTDLVIKTAQKNGLIVYPCRGLINSTFGDAIIVAPPLNSTDAELDSLASRLYETLSQVADVKLT
ncbi:Aminotransferase, s III [Pseudomonas coronafaciens pv. oryzae]|uniref:aminotransferase class III-fold pyridoxal phosphate-dependent enzyme n=1 Tax=Pseudomonas syringae group TaxID=136849 RepID=UPI0006B44025|nr:aminotransferase class III-fold pyridoxal phosphate-dependent enzyme [Pseudomonas coronafaciens]KPB49638.1 Aminotransferase [Pseudomonas coronafaciens pv. oryzae]KPY04360.1 Aminotransferase, s III [Pseudomonas coronafaciens pv. oryzae]RMS98171.1 Aminotransferase, s III [Pseudomonas coronafaciens pv. oryzae]